MTGLLKVNDSVLHDWGIAIILLANLMFDSRSSKTQTINASFLSRSTAKLLAFVSAFQTIRPLCRLTYLTDSQSILYGVPLICFCDLQNIAKSNLALAYFPKLKYSIAINTETKRQGIFSCCSLTTYKSCCFFQPVQFICSYRVG